jgi:hypothetical protein
VLEDTATEDPRKLCDNVEGEYVDPYLEEIAWDDVNNIPLPLDLVRRSRAEEMARSRQDKTHGAGEPMVRSRWVARQGREGQGGPVQCDAADRDAPIHDFTNGD